MLALLTTLPKYMACDAKLLRLYRRRWVIELDYRGREQSFDIRKLKSKCKKSAHIELQWSLLGFWAMCQHTQPRILEAGFVAQRLSCVKMLSVYRHLIRDWRHKIEKSSTLADWLRKAKTASNSKKGALNR